MYYELLHNFDHTSLHPQKVRDYILYNYDGSDSFVSEGRSRVSCVIAINRHAHYHRHPLRDKPLHLSAPST